MDALMAITGAGGACASAFYKMTDESIDKVLRSIVGYAKWRREALRIESGIWDTRTRADISAGDAIFHQDLFVGP